MSAAEQIITNSFRLSRSMLCVFDQNGIIQEESLVKADKSVRGGHSTRNNNVLQ